MRISNMLHFTENHPFYAGRFFSLGNLHYTMLHSIYQPMIGTMATSLYHVLYELLPAHQVGYTPIEQQRKLFLSLQLEPGVEGRRRLIEATSRLEAVGLLQTTRTYSGNEEEYLYGYHLLSPLMPHEFFASPHLVFLLRDTIGRSALLRLKERLLAPSPLEAEAEQDIEELTVPFYELFRLGIEREGSDMDVVLDELAAGSVVEKQDAAALIGYPYEEIVRRFPRASRNRPYVVKLERRKDQFAFINYTAGKYRLELQELCRLLDEDGIFDEAGELNEDVFAYRASLSYMQGNRRREERDMLMQRSLTMRSAKDAAKHDAPDDGETPVEESYQLEVPGLFAGKCDKQQYNQLLRNEPYTAVLERFFQGKPSTHVVRLFERIHYSYKMPDEVLNVMMHYIHTNKLSWSKAFVESIFTDLLAREVRSFEGAVEYIRERLRIAEKGKEKGDKRGTSSGSRSRKSNKPHIPIVTDNVPDDPVSDEEYEQILQEVRRIQSKLQTE